MRKFAWFFLSVIAIGTPACSSSTTTGGTPTPSVSCLSQVGATSALVFPAQNATNVPDNLGQVIIGTTTTLPSSWNVQLFTTAGFLVASGNTLGPAPSPLPTPNTIPPFPNPNYQQSSLPLLPAATTLQVGVNNLNSSCIPTIVGVFTTQ